MNKNHFKIHILSIKALTETTFADGGKKYAIINCSERTSQYFSSQRYLLQLHFIDTEDEKNPKSFSLDDGEKIKSFIVSLPSNITDLFVLCDAGESRSTAVAAAILLFAGRSDEPVWNNPFYHPNPLVFRRLCKAFGIEMAEDQIGSKKKQNENAFKSAMKSGTQYKRWEVI